MNHEQLLRITEDMPCKTIEINGRPYLRRYYAGPAEGGGMWMYHQFLTADAERHLHSHSSTATSMILCGHYVEEVLQGEGSGKFRNRRHWRPGMVNRINPSTIHRIAEIEPNTWTLLHVEPGREPTWRFIDDDGREQVMQSSPEDWYLQFAPRRDESPT